MESENSKICGYINLQNFIPSILVPINSQHIPTITATQRYLPQNAVGLHCTSILLSSLYIFNKLYFRRSKYFLSYSEFFWVCILKKLKPLIGK